jgi:hypothetical protein
MRFFSAIISIILLCLSADAAAANDVKLGTLTLSHAWSRATPNGAQVAAGYLEIVNAGETNDRLIAVHDDIAAMTGLHEMSMDANGVMKMGEVKGGIVIPAHQSVTLKPHGLHIMFMDLKHPLKQGDVVPVELVFEKSGKVTIDFVVGAIDAIAAPTGQ